MRVKNTELYDNIMKSKHTEEEAIILSFAMNWAILMEDELRQGKEVDDIFMETSFTACKEYNLNKTQVSLAVATLTDIWVYGDKLRLAWNKKWAFEG